MFYRDKGGAEGIGYGDGGSALRGILTTSVQPLGSITLWFVLIVLEIFESWQDG
jgi:hypothetical protein